MQNPRGPEPRHNDRPFRAANPYAGVIEGWKVSLVRQRARLMGFRSHEMDDVLQELALPILRFRYRPERSNGATEKTALCALIDRQLKALVRKQTRYRKHLKRLRASRYGFNSHGKHVPPRSADFRTPDVELAPTELLASVPAECREVCRLLFEFDSVNAIAEQLGWGWHRVHRYLIRAFEHLQRRERRGGGQ